MAIRDWYVDQESAQELICGERHDLLLATVRIVFPAKRDLIVLERNQSMIGDGDAVRIASEIVQNMLGTAEGGLGIDDPVLAKELSLPGFNRSSKPGSSFSHP
jgi:hypothetical protein